MYIPPMYKVEDENVYLSLCKANPLATLVSLDAVNTMYVSHIPLIVEKKTKDQIVLTGYMSKRNSQWLYFKMKPFAKAIFTGPQAYVNPNWYKKNDIPTWNYTAVHMDGEVKLFEDAAGVSLAIQKLAELVKPYDEDPWRYEIPPEFSDPKALTAAFVAFEISVTNILAQYKLSQERPRDEVTVIASGLHRRKDDDSKKVSDLMSKKIFTSK